MSHEGLNGVARDLMRLLRTERRVESNVLHNVTSHFFKWSLEGTSS